MSFKIVADSCTDLTADLKKNEHFVIVPLTLSVGGVDIVDDDTFDQKDFLKRVSECPECPHSACPSPEKYMEEYQKAQGDVYVVTLSSELSGSYNSAIVGAQMYKEQGGVNNVHVVNSRSASAGQLCIALKLFEMASAGMEFARVVDEIEKYRDEMETHFVLETLETLRKNGRLSTMNAIIAKALNIKPVMCATPQGTIEKVEQLRGMNKALIRMVEIINEKTKNQSEKTMVIAHCNNEERAKFVKAEVEKVCSFKRIVITDTAGVASMYASDGGIVVSA